MTTEEAKKLIQERIDKSDQSVDVNVMMERLIELKDSPSTVLKLQQQIIALAYFVWVTGKATGMQEELSDSICKDLKVTQAHIAGLTLTLNSPAAKAVGL